MVVGRRSFRYLEGTFSGASCSTLGRYVLKVETGWNHQKWRVGGSCKEIFQFLGIPGSLDIILVVTGIRGEEASQDISFQRFQRRWFKQEWQQYSSWEWECIQVHEDEQMRMKSRILTIYVDTWETRFKEVNIDSHNIEITHAKSCECMMMYVHTLHTTLRIVLP